MAIYYGMLTVEEKPKVLKLLIKYIADEDGHFYTGVLGGRVIYRVLAENGHVDLAYNMIVRPDYPSYGNWIKRGRYHALGGLLPRWRQSVIAQSPFLGRYFGMVLYIPCRYKNKPDGQGCDEC